MKVRTVIEHYRDRYGVEHKLGDEFELPDHVAIKLFNNGIAVPVREKAVETAVVEPPEKTAAVRPKKAAPRTPRKAVK